MTLLLSILLLINTIKGTFMFLEITRIEVETQEVENMDSMTDMTTEVNIKRISMSDNFDLEDVYMVHGIILLLLPSSIFIFLTILLVKVLCFYFVENQRGIDGNFSKLRQVSYGIFNEEEEVQGSNGLDTETIDEVTIGYVRNMQRIIYDGESTLNN